MVNFPGHFPLLIFVLMCILSSCITNNLEKEKTASTPVLTKGSSTSTTDREVCPTSPKNYEKIPEYNPGTVDPSILGKTIEIISPTLLGNPTFYLGILQKTVKFCGIAQSNIIKVKLFSTGAYIYEKNIRFQVSQNCSWVKHRSKVGCGFSPMTLGRKGREV
jgi:hypothetical protein